MVNIVKGVRMQTTSHSITVTLRQGRNCKLLTEVLEKQNGRVTVGCLQAAEMTEFPHRWAVTSELLIQGKWMYCLHRRLHKRDQSYTRSKRLLYFKRVCAHV